MIFIFLVIKLQLKLITRTIVLLNYIYIYIHISSLGAQRVKHLPARQENWVQSLGQEDPLEKEMATHSGTVAWRIPWMEKPGAGYSPWGLKESDTTE